MATATEVAGTWLGNVYGRPDLPPVRQRDVLVMLAVRCAEDGPDRRIASIDSLSFLCATARSTVQRALRWAKRAGLLVVARRGHWVSPGVSVPTIWQLVVEWLRIPTRQDPTYASI
jgi:hypothetical protein